MSGQRIDALTKCIKHLDCAHNELANHEVTVTGNTRMTDLAIDLRDTIVGVIGRVRSALAAELADEHLAGALRNETIRPMAKEVDV